MLIWNGFYIARKTERLPIKQAITWSHGVSRAKSNNNLNVPSERFMVQDAGERILHPAGINKANLR